jgi:coenzyme F420 hydrogenase subunit beta
MNSDKEAVETIEQIAKNDLCTGCGTCVAMCPKEAIEMRIDERKGIYVPKINEERCNCCGLCHRVCPGHSVDFKALNLDIFGNEPEDVLIGNYQGCYLGHATDDNLRYNAASGGVVTALLLFALEKGLIDGALVTKMSEENPLEPQPFIARTKEEIISACKSKYCPVPANIASRKICEEEGKFAVVGLPCHIQGLRKAESINKTLKEKIVLHLGIFCSHTDTFWQTEFLLRKLNLNENDIVKIDYRGKGWPGEMSILLKKGKTITVPYYEAILLHRLWLHVPIRCAFCCDLTSELADVSCGDAWLPEILDYEKMGKSIVIPRTKIGETLCTEAVQKGYVRLKKTSSYKVKQCGDMMQTKKKDIKVRFFLRRVFNKSIPTYNTTLLRPRPINYLRGVLVYLNVVVSSKVYLRRFIGTLLRIELLVITYLRRINL